MTKSSRLHDKSFKKKFKECILQLNMMISTNGINLKQKNLLSSFQEESKMQSIVDSENSSNVEVKNMWGQKDTTTILKERNDKIYSLENELEELKNTNTKLLEERKRMKIEVMNSSNSEVIENMLEEKRKELANLSSTTEGYKAKIKELECQLNISKGANDILKDSNKRLSELTNKKSPVISNRNFLLEIQRIFESEQELIRLRGLTAELELNQSISEDKNKMLEERIEVLAIQIADYENRIKQIDKKGSTNETEAALIEELENISMAYDQMMVTNKNLEERLSNSLKINTELKIENSQVKNRIKMLEDSKQFIESEKRRLEEWKDILLNETRSFEEKLVILENQIGEKDKKIADYKILLTTLQTSNKVLENEVSAIGTTFRTTQNELLALKSENKTLQCELEDMKRVCNSYKSLYNADSDVIDEIERYKKVIRCSLCNINIKNSVIVKCMHVFCDSCLDERLKARQRKCPNCQIEFNSGDIKRIYF